MHFGLIPSAKEAVRSNATVFRPSGDLDTIFFIDFNNPALHIATLFVKTLYSHRIFFENDRPFFSFQINSSRRIFLLVNDTDLKKAPNILWKRNVLFLGVFGRRN